MGRIARTFCWAAVMMLDPLPRYGRWCHELPEDSRLKHLSPLVLGGWRWYRQGQWGCLLLQKLGLLDRYREHHERLVLVRLTGARTTEKEAP
jgi:hypothetical protein